jgi:uncharacterized protein (TIGR03437 family)
MWLAGSRHTLTTNQGQDQGSAKTTYTFQGWQYVGGLLSNNTEVTVTADPAIQDIYASFQVQHALSLSFAGCAAGPGCFSPGTLSVNGTAYSGDADIFLSEGTQITLTAVAAPGYVFLGWQPGSNQQINGFSDIVTLNSPTIVRPIFQLARGVNLATDPAELVVLADRATVATPATLDWAYGSTHTLGAPSPQSDQYSRWWIFSRWSDGGPQNRTYTVEDGRVPLTFTAIFVPATETDLRTVPTGLNLIVDGRDNWSNFQFPWGAGETHRIEAPAQQTDSQGRVWQFSSWSNGGDRVQQYVVPAGDQGATVRLTATYAPMGHVTVTSAVAGLVVKIDGAECATPCDVVRPVGATLRLAAPASLPLGDGSRADFDGWPGSGSFAPEWSPTLTANPVALRLTYHTMNRLQTSSDPAGEVAWRFDPASPDGYYDASATVVVTAVAQPGFRFRAWAGDAGGSAPAASVAMNAPRLVEAILDRIPYIAPAGVANAAGGPPDSGVAPGSIVSIFGASFTSGTTAAPDGSAAQALGCVTVRSGGRLLPLFFVSPSQINFQLPDDTPIGEQQLVVSCQGLPDVGATFQVAPNAPGLFADAIVHQDGTAVTGDSPARAGEVLTVYGTGFGPAAAPRPFGFPLPAESAIRDTVSVQAGDAVVVPEKAYAVAGRIGVDAAQFRIPDNASGPMQVRVTVNGKVSNPLTAPF